MYPVRRHLHAIVVVSVSGDTSRNRSRHHYQSISEFIRFVSPIKVAVVCSIHSPANCSRANQWRTPLVRHPHDNWHQRTCTDPDLPSKNLSSPKIAFQGDIQSAQSGEGCEPHLLPYILRTRKPSAPDGCAAVTDRSRVLPSRDGKSTSSSSTTILKTYSTRFSPRLVKNRYSLRAK